MAPDEEWGGVYEIAPRERSDIRSVLSGVQLFESLTGDELDQLIPILHHRDFYPLEVIVHQGAPGSGLYTILSGGADVVLHNEKGEDILLTSLGDGRMFGEVSLLDGEPRSATVVSNARSHVVGFFKADLMDLVEHSPQLGFKIVYRISQLMTGRLREAISEYRENERRVRRARRRAAIRAQAAKANGTGAKPVPKRPA